MRLCANVLDIADAEVEKLGRPEGLCLTGTLTGFERVPAEYRRPILEAFERNAVYEDAFPEEFAHALGMYPSAPGLWLIGPWLTRGLSVNPSVAQALLAPVVAASSHGQADTPTRAKFMFIRAFLKAGRIRVAPGLRAFEGFDLYPDKLASEDERKKVEESARAMFLAFHMDAETESIPVECLRWSKAFWRSNWQIYSCILPEEPATDGPTEEEVSKAVKALTQDAGELYRTIVRVATTTDPDIYCPDRHEVLTGIAARTVRTLCAVTLIPPLWSEDLGAPMLRTTVESLIVLRWLAKRDDPKLYERFKDYGRGRLKLFKLHLEEYIDSLEDEARELEDLLKHLDAVVNQDLWEEWQEIDLGATFPGMDTRKMAAEVDLEQEYKLVFAPMSSASHGEWTTLDRFVLQRCRNPLHKWHRIPPTDPSFVMGPNAVQASMEFAHELVNAYVDAMQLSGTASVINETDGSEEAN